MKKRLAVLSLSGVILVSGLMTSAVEASTYADAMMDKVIDKIMEEKENGNSLYYNLVVGYKDHITVDTLGALYKMLSQDDRARVRSQLGEGITDEDIINELENLTSSDIRKIKNKIEEIAPSTGGSGSTGGGSGSDTKQESEKTEEKPTEETIVEVGEKALEAEKSEVKISFTDISSLWQEAQDAIEFMANKGILQGKAEGLFAPQDPITRAEFAKTIVALLNLTNDTAVVDKTFTDVVNTDWYYDYVQIAYKYGIIQGRDEEVFAPKDLITRQEMAVMISRTMKAMDNLEIVPTLQQKEIISAYNDYNDIADWAQQDIVLVVKNKIIQGKDGGLLAPKDNATRAEAVVILKRFYDLLNN